MVEETRIRWMEHRLNEIGREKQELADRLARLCRDEVGLALQLAYLKSEEREHEFA
jgi:hypothetical protein